VWVVRIEFVVERGDDQVAALRLERADIDAGADWPAPGLDDTRLS
jgi:hypothetical protein